MGSEQERARVIDEYAKELRHAIRTFGPASDDAKRRAIRLCELLGRNPHARYPLQQSTTSVGDLGDAPVQRPQLPFEEEWQRLIAQAMAGPTP